MSKELIRLLYYFYYSMNENIDNNILIINADPRLSIIATNIEPNSLIGDIIAYKILRNND